VSSAVASFLTLAIATAAGCSGVAVGEDDGTLDPSAVKGNGAPSGPHFTLNLIGVTNTGQEGGAGGSVMFVPLFGSTKINLSEGDFAVLDKDCVDGSCQFQLPNPDPTNSGTTTYSVFARALGTPGGSSTSTTCATDKATGETFCSVFVSVQTRTGGQSTFTNVSRELLFIFADVDGDGKLERFPLFDDRLQDFFWQYDNNGLRLLQYRFYQVATTVQ
jgi:hypothetical protein